MDSCPVRVGGEGIYSEKLADRFLLESSSLLNQKNGDVNSALFCKLMKPMLRKCI